MTRSYGSGEAEALPWASVETYRRIFDSVDEAISLHRVDGRIIDLNQTMLRMYGVTREQALRMSIARDFSTPDYPAERLREIWQTVIAGNNQLFPWRARRGDTGAFFDVEVFLTGSTSWGNRPYWPACAISVNGSGLKTSCCTRRKWRP